MDSVDEYRRRAEDCLRLARLMQTEQDRRTMQAAAKRWRALAGQPVSLGLQASPSSIVVGPSREQQQASAGS